MNSLTSYVFERVKSSSWQPCVTACFNQTRRVDDACVPGANDDEGGGANDWLRWTTKPICPMAGETNSRVSRVRPLFRANIAQTIRPPRGTSASAPGDRSRGIPSTGAPADAWRVRRRGGGSERRRTNPGRLFFLAAAFIENRCEPRRPYHVRGAEPVVRARGALRQIARHARHGAVAAAAAGASRSILAVVPSSCYPSSPRCPTPAVLFPLTASSSPTFPSRSTCHHPNNQVGVSLFRVSPLSSFHSSVAVDTRFGISI